MQSLPVTAVVLTYNEADMLPGCLQTLRWCEQLLIIDSHSTDQTVAIAKSAGARIVSSTEPSFAKRRELAIEHCQTKWLIYIDADERCTPELVGEIASLVSDGKTDVITLSRRNYFYGSQIAHGGWETEQVTRLFKKSALKGWRGDIHESPEFVGAVSATKQPLWHFTHRSVVDGLFKSARWTPMEATALAADLKSKVTSFTILRKGLGEIWRRGLLKRGWKDGQVGWIETFTQAINRMLVYMQVWELQQQPTIPEQYKKLDEAIAAKWRQAS